MSKYIPYHPIVAPQQLDVHQKMKNDLSSDEAKRIYDAISRVIMR